MSKRMVRVYFQRLTPESVEENESSAEGHDEDIPIQLDAVDRSDGLTVADLAAKVIVEAGARPSDSRFRRGMWYATEWTTLSYQTGEQEEKTYHLKGFTHDEEAAVYLKVKRDQR